MLVIVFYYVLNFVCICIKENTLDKVDKTFKIDKTTTQG